MQGTGPGSSPGRWQGTEPARGHRGSRHIAEVLMGRRDLFTHCGVSVGLRAGSLQDPTGPLEFPSLLLGSLGSCGVPGPCMAPVGLGEAPGHECPPPLPGLDCRQFQISA